MSSVVGSDLQPPQGGAGGVLHLIKQLVLSKRKDGNQLSSVTWYHRTTVSVLVRTPPPPIRTIITWTHPCFRASLMKPFLFSTWKIKII